jgi:hypothetical protein
MPQASVTEGWAVLADVRLAPGERRQFDFLP